MIHIAKQPKRYDALVVGSGISGGWAAKTLTEAGLETLVIERGRHVEHAKDYHTEFKAPWELPLGDQKHTLEINEQQPIQKKCYAFKQSTKHFFINDKENPYKTAGKTQFNWLRGDQLGGKSLLWHRQSYRWSPMDFEANQRDGHGTDWPIRYQDLAKWYDQVEEFVGISGTDEGLPQLPDSKFIQPFELNVAERYLKTQIEKKYQGRNLIIGRCAHLTEPTLAQTKLGRGRCMVRNECQRGCSFGAYFSSLSATLPAAKLTDKLTVVTDKLVMEVLYDEARNRATGVRVFCRQTGQHQEYHAKLVVLCASTLASTQILLNSRSPAFPTGLGNRSGVLGHYLMDHPFGAGAMGTFVGLSDRNDYGRRPTGIYIPRFKNLDGKNKDFYRGYGYQGEAYRERWHAFSGDKSYGTELKGKIERGGDWKMYLEGFGEMLPRFENRMYLDFDDKDAYGMPKIVLDCDFGKNERTLLKDMRETAGEMLEAAGLKNVETFDWQVPMGHCIHEMGTARMGRDANTSFLNGFNQSHEVPNLFVTDGSAMASSACQNPSLTYMAMTARACSHAAKLLKDQQI